jgi:hypothetical protein
MRKWLLVAALLLIGLPACAALLVRYLLSPDVLRPAIERQATAALGRRVTVGAARARLFPRAGLTLEDVRVAGAQPLSAEEVVVDASLRALLRRQIDDATVRVRTGRVVLDAQGDAAPVVTGAPGDTPYAVTILSVREIVFENVILAGGGREVRLDLRGALQGDRLDVGRLAIRSGATAFDGTGTVTSLARRDGDFSVAGPLLDVDEVLAILKALTPPGSLAAAPAIGHVRARMRADAARALGYEGSQLETELELRGGTLLARPLAFEFYGGRYAGTLDLDLATSTITHDAAVTGASVGRLVALVGQAGAATGTVDVSMRVQGTGADFAGAARAARGTAHVRVAGGTIAGLDVVRQTFRLLGVSSPRTSQGERFETIVATVAVAGGGMSTDRFHMHSPDFDLTGRLRVSPAHALSGRADLILSEALSTEAQQRNRDLKLTFEGGRITLPATIGGTLTHPQVVPDLAAALTRAARSRVLSEIEKARKKAADRIRRELDRIIK